MLCYEHLPENESHFNGSRQIGFQKQLVHLFLSLKIDIFEYDLNFSCFHHIHSKMNVHALLNAHFNSIWLNAKFKFHLMA